MSIATRRTPERATPLFSGIVVQKQAVVPFIVTSGTTPVTLTVAQVLTGFLAVDCQDTGTITLPTASQLIAAIPGIEVGSAIQLDITNFGDSTLTVAIGTGITIKVYASKTCIVALTQYTATTCRLVCTGIIANGSTSDSFDLYTAGLTTAVA